MNVPYRAGPGDKEDERLTHLNVFRAPPTSAHRHVSGGTAEVARILNLQSVKLTVVRFRDGAQSGWHVHPGGEQVLIWLTDGGVVGTPDGRVTACKAGDVFHVPAGARHLHCAQAGRDADHVSIVVGEDGTEWLDEPLPEPVAALG
jgi:quercetin dioxygenase-like cupin family protein